MALLKNKVKPLKKRGLHLNIMKKEFSVTANGA